MMAKQETRNLQTSISLEPVAHTRETLDAWVQWINDPDIRRWMYSDLPKSSDEINEWLFNATHDERRHYFTIRANGKMVGFVSLRQDHAPETSAEIGIVIGEKEYQSRGIGSLTIDAIDTYAKNTVGLTSIRAMIKPDNEKSIQLFTRHGYVHTNDVTINNSPFQKYIKQL